MKISKVLERLDDGRLMFYCPGCKSHHVVNVQAGKSPCWGYDGNAERPTFSPSILVQSSRPDRNGEMKPFTLCHSFVINGRIQFLTDCAHELAGQTVDIPEIE